MDFLKSGLLADWNHVMPKPRLFAKNYLKSDTARLKCQNRFKNEIKKGRMLGGPGWSAVDVRRFLNRPFFVAPCGAVPKGTDPHGRIVHNYSSKVNGLSLNDALNDTSVKYISFKKRVHLLHKMKWYIKVDLKEGYRQLAVHPSEWHTQVYMLNNNEYYIDIAMPFGKANSSSLFCMWTDLWFSSFLYWFNLKYDFPATLGSYVDDAFGGTNTEKDAHTMIVELLQMGRKTFSIFNAKKTGCPARALEILGLLYSSITKSCRLGKKKI